MERRHRYVKSSTESNADVGDKANDAIRVDGKDLRVKVVGEGGNLGLTQLGRIEFALHGGRINTDAIDNSAGVDTSDHEVNIKILLNGLVADGDMTVKQRNKLLAEMTDEVGHLVLRNNYAQNTAIANALAQSKDMLHAQQRFMKHLVREGHLDRAPGVPAHRPADPRAARPGAGPDQPGDGRPAGVHEDHGRRGAAAHLAAGRPVPAGPAALLLPDRAARAVPGPSRRAPAAPRDRHDGPGQRHGQHGRYDVSAPAARGDRRVAGGDRPGPDGGPGDLPPVAGVGRGRGARQQGRGRRPDPYPAALAPSGGARHALAAQQPAAAAPAAETVDFFAERVEQVWTQLPKLLRGADLEWYQKIYDELTDVGVPDELATRVAGFSSAFPTLDIVSIADRMGREPLDVADVYYDLADRLRITQLMDRIIELPRADRWQSMARAAIREDLYAAHAALTADVLAVGDGTSTPEQRYKAWEQKNAAILGRARTTLEEIQGSEAFDLANLSVAMRTMRTLLRTHS
ncbi:NAD-specific glutamate dehydrogenase [Streptomyces violarus]